MRWVGARQRSIWQALVQNCKNTKQHRTCGGVCSSEAISVKIHKSFNFYVMSCCFSRAFSVGGNLFLDKGAGEHRRHLMIYTPEGRFGPRGCFWTFAGLVLLFPCRPNQHPAAWGGLGAASGEQMKKSWKVNKVNNKMPLGQSHLFTTFLFLLGLTVRQQQKGGEARLLLFRLFCFCLAAFRLFTGVSDISLFGVWLQRGSPG